MGGGLFYSHLCPCRGGVFPLDKADAAFYNNNERAAAYQRFSPDKIGLVSKEKPSPAGVAVSAFTPFNHDRDREVLHMKRNTHLPHLLSEDVAEPPTVCSSALPAPVRGLFYYTCAAAVCQILSIHIRILRPSHQVVNGTSKVIRNQNQFLRGNFRGGFFLPLSKQAQRYAGILSNPVMR